MTFTHDKILRLHLMPDEKVINNAISSFEQVFPQQNLYVIFVHQNHKAQYVSPAKNRLFLDYNSPEYHNILKNITSFQQIILHSLWDDVIKSLKEVEHPNISWIIWGADLYECLLAPKGFKVYADKSSAYKVRCKAVSSYLPSLIGSLLIYCKEMYRFYQYKKMLAKITTIYSDIFDYDIFTKYFPEYSYIQNKRFFYYPIQKIISFHSDNKLCNGKNIVIGNAAAINGNHEKIMKILLQKNIIHNQIIMPLSYGQHFYGCHIEKLGYKYFGSSFQPIKDFLPIQEYYDIFFSANVFIYGHLRQAAIGNIVVALYFGGKVFLFKENPIYDYLLSIGITVFEINELTNEMINTRLSIEIIRHNRKIILENYSEQLLFALIQDGFK